MMSDTIRLMIVDTTSKKYLERVKKYIQGMPFELVLAENEDEESLKAVAPQAEAILCYQSPLPGSVIRSASSLKFIQKHGLNCKNIDMAAARERGIPVATMPLMRNASAAEKALMLMLCCAQKAIPGHKAVAEAEYRAFGIEPIQTSQWDFKTNWTKIEGITELFGASVGIIGLGDIGMDIASRCRAFNMEVLYHQRTPHPKEIEAAYGATYLPFDDLLVRADYVVLVVPHTPKTEGLIGTAELSKMKSTATLINVGRGGLVDEDALYTALNDGKIAMAGLDVYRQEPLPESSPLRELTNIVFSPHAGGGSYRYTAIDVLAVLKNILKFFRGENARGIVP